MGCTQSIAAAATGWLGRVGRVVKGAMSRGCSQGRAGVGMGRQVAIWVDAVGWSRSWIL